MEVGDTPTWGTTSRDVRYLKDCRTPVSGLEVSAWEGAEAEICPTEPGSDFSGSRKARKSLYRSGVSAPTVNQSITPDESASDPGSPSVRHPG